MISIANIRKAKQILKEHGIEIALEKVSDIWGAIEKAGDPLSEEEHGVLFDVMWDLGNKKRGSNVTISDGVKTKIIKNRHKIIYRMAAEGHIECGNINSIIKACRLDGSEQVELWSIFHKLWPKSSERDCEEINSILGLFKIVNHKLKWLRKINVLDIGCGTNGNAIATLTERYKGKINGFGVDMDIKDHPSNVNLVRANIKKLPFKDNNFEVVYSSNAIYYFNDKEIVEVLKEILRVMKPKAMFVFDDGQRNAKQYEEEIIPKTGIGAKAIKNSDGTALITKR